MITIERANRSDLPDVLALLRANSLPTDGVAEHVDTFFVARLDGKVLGTAGLEWYEDGALLRSVAVAASSRGAGLGLALTRAALEAAEGRGTEAVFLLTTTADRFFPRFGFERITREDVPVSVRRSVEFASACPESAVVMRRVLR